MYSRRLALGVLPFLWAVVAAHAQTPTPTAVISNVAISTYAQSRGQDLQGNPCTSQGADGCGGCYPEGIPPPNDEIAGLLGQLALVNPEWQAIGPMIPGVDSSLPPVAVPVLVTGTVGLSKSPGDDFPGTHISPDYNAEIIPDDNGQLATGNGTHRVEFEWEGDKLPLFAWSGEGDRILALGRWIFDCGHADPGPQGKCSNDGTRVCNVDADCAGGGTCSAPVPTFNYQSEMHPPQAVVVIRDKSIGKTPATRADVFISPDAGGASDRCTVTHLADPLGVLLDKACFLNHCSVTTARSCMVDADCARSETCIRLDPTNRLADINASNFTFDIPLPARPAGATKVKVKAKKLKTKILKNLLSARPIMPKPTLIPDLTAPTPVVHVVVPMATPMRQGMPNVFAESISAAWVGDKTKLKKVQVKFTGITVNNPVKDDTPAVPRVCTDVVNGGLSSTACTTDKDCPAGTCANNGASCFANSDCARTDHCDGASQCLGGTAPGWRVWGEVNGDWGEFAGLSAVGTEAPFAAPPYMQPATLTTIKQKLKFKEYVPADGSVHIKVSGRSLNCENVTLFGQNVKDNLQRLGLSAGAACLLATSKDPGTVDITYNGPDFSTPTGTATTCTPKGSLQVCTATADGGDAGTCSTTTSQLCVSNADCPSEETCNVTGGAFTLQYTMLVK